MSSQKRVVHSSGDDARSCHFPCPQAGLGWAHAFLTPGPASSLLQGKTHSPKAAPGSCGPAGAVLHLLPFSASMD